LLALDAQNLATAKGQKNQIHKYFTLYTQPSLSSSELGFNLIQKLIEIVVTLSDNQRVVTATNNAMSQKDTVSASSSRSV
jgi:hypothetical protein